MKKKPAMNPKESRAIDSLPDEPLNESLSEKEEKESIEKLARIAEGEKVSKR
jgi:hypothetical protein